MTPRTAEGGEATGLILVTGLPRSGTTWVAKVLAAGTGAVYNHEPDNEKLHITALAGKSGLGRFPALAHGTPARAFDRLWRQGFAGPASRTARVADKVYLARVDPEKAVTGRTPQPVRLAGASLLGPRRRRKAPDLVVKSVHIPLCLEHVASLADPAVVVVTRDPRSVLASWVEMGMPDADRRLDERRDVRTLYLDARGLPLPSTNADSFERKAWQCAFMSWAIRDAVSRNPGWTTVEHESLVAAGVAGFGSLAVELGRGWRPEGTDLVTGNAASGVGYETKRAPSELRERWRRTLSDSQVATAEAVCRSFSP